MICLCSFRVHDSMLGGHTHRYFLGRFDYGEKIGMNIFDSVPKDVEEDIGTPRWVGGVHFQRLTGEDDAHDERLGEATGHSSRTSRPLTWFQALETIPA
jgi:hypothetical protein